LEGFRIGGLRIVMGGEGINGVDRVWNFPAHVWRHDRLLVKLCPFPNEALTPGRVAIVGKIDLAGVASRNQRWPSIDGSMAIDASDGRGVTRLTVELTIAMHIHFEMAIGALHSTREMHIFEVN